MKKSELKARVEELQAENDALREVIRSADLLFHKPMLMERPPQNDNGIWSAPVPFTYTARPNSTLRYGP